MYFYFNVSYNVCAHVHVCFKPKFISGGQRKSYKIWFSSHNQEGPRYRAQVKKISDKHIFHLAILLSCIFIIKFLITILCVYELNVSFDFKILT